MPMGIFKRLRKLEQKLAIHLRDHAWHERTTPDAGQLQERITQLEVAVGRMMAQAVLGGRQEAPRPERAAQRETGEREDGYA